MKLSHALLALSALLPCSAAQHVPPGLQGQGAPVEVAPWPADALEATCAPGWQPTFLGLTTETTIRPAELFLEGWVDTGCAPVEPCPQAGQLGVPINVWHAPYLGADPVDGLSYLVASVDTEIAVIGGLELYVSPRHWFTVDLAQGGAGIAQHVIETPSTPGLAGTVVYLQAFVESEEGLWRASSGAALGLYP